MDIVVVDGKEYDPYFILDVTKDDSSDHITRSFRTKVKKYHPDKYTDKTKKQKYEQYFKILTESYQYIKNKRESARINKRGHKTKDKQITEKELDSFNEQFNKKSEQDNSQQSESYQRLSNLEEYDAFKADICNQFSDKKFSNEEFNDIFEYAKQKDEEYDKVIEKTLIHKTTDGFRGYNSSDFGNCALVSSFNGLLISGDILGENGAGYWGSGYSDYKYSYKRARNPNSKVVVPKDAVKKRIINKITNSDVDEYKKKYNIKLDFDKNQKQIDLDEMIYQELVEKEKTDEMMVKKYISQYDKNTIEKALNGDLDQSQTYKSVLQRNFINRG